jgi:hypothetical protein
MSKRNRGHFDAFFQETFLKGKYGTSLRRNSFGKSPSARTYDSPREARRELAADLQFYNEILTSWATLFRFL